MLSAFIFSLPIILVLAIAGIVHLRDRAKVGKARTVKINRDRMILATTPRDVRIAYKRMK